MSEVPGLIVQPADNTQSLAAAQLIHSTSPEYLTYIHLDDESTSIDHLAHHWASEEGFFSHRLASSIVENNELLGIELGYPAAKKGDLSPGFLNEAISFFADSRAKNVLFRLRDTNSYIFPAAPNSSYYIQNLAANPAAQGRGIGKRLLEQAFEKTRNLDLSSCYLDVASNNPAIQFYEHMGMKIIGESRIYFLEEAGVPSYYRMVIHFD